MGKDALGFGDVKMVAMMGGSSLMSFSLNVGAARLAGESRSLTQLPAAPLFALDRLVFGDLLRRLRLRVAWYRAPARPISKKSVGTTDSTDFTDFPLSLSRDFAANAQRLFGAGSSLKKSVSSV
jgi:hypothetical protein